MIFFFLKHLFLFLNNWKKKTEIIQTGKTAGRTNSLVGDDISGGKVVSNSILVVTFEMPTRHSDKDVQNAVRELNLDFWGEI